MTRVEKVLQTTAQLYVVSISTLSQSHGTPLETPTYLGISIAGVVLEVHGTQELVFVFQR
jgi:hypothetical protein